MADDEPRNSSCTASSATSSGGSSTSPSPPSPAPASASASAAHPLPLVAVAAAPPPFAPASISASIATAIPLPQQQLLQQYQQQFHQQQRLLSLQLSSAAASSPPATVKHPLLPSPSPPSAAHHVDHPASAPIPAPGGADRHSRDDCWSEGATITLIHAWGDRYLELNRGNLKQKHWKDVAESVNRRAEPSKAHKTDIQCKNRLDTLKKKYKLEKSKIITGGGPSKWPFFDRLDELIGPSKKPKKPMPAVKLRPSLPLMPAPAAPLLLASTKHEPDQLPPPPPPPPPPPLPLLLSLPPISNHCASPTVNHVAPNHHLGSAADTSSKSKESPDMTDSCPNVDATAGKGLKRKRSHDDPMKELAQAIIKFGEIYERIEISKQQKMVELEKQRMIFTKDLELQRIQFFMQTQVELAKLKHSSKHGNADNCS